MRFTVFNRILPLSLLTLLSGCALMGTQIIRHDRGQYGYEVAKSDNAQMLNNIVKMRYFDSVNFLQVTNITAQKTLASSISPAMTVPYLARTSSNSIGSSVSLTDAPTISLSPLQGADFVSSLLTTVSFKSIVYINNTHWDLETILLLSIDRINDYFNAFGVVNPTTKLKAPNHEQFIEVVKCLARLQAVQAIAMYYEETKDGTEQLIIFFNHRRARKTELKLKRLLDINPKSNFMILSPIYNSKTINNVVSVKTRSLSIMLAYLANQVDMTKLSGKIAELKPDKGVPIIKIQSSLTPVHASINTFYNDAYFYIDDEDIKSKRTFSMLTEFYQMTAGLPAKNNDLVLTLPVGPR